MLTSFKHIYVVKLKIVLFGSDIPTIEKLLSLVKRGYVFIFLTEAHTYAFIDLKQNYI